MSTQRGLVPPAIIGSTVSLVVCAMAWGAIGMITLDDPNAMPVAVHRFACILLATVTICSVLVNVVTRALRSVLAGIERNHDAISSGEGGYATGYADGLAAAPVSPGVSRLVPSRR